MEIVKECNRKEIDNGIKCCRTCLNSNTRKHVTVMEIDFDICKIGIEPSCTYQVCNKWEPM